MSSSDEMSERIKELFDEYDSNKNGVLDREEFFIAFKGLIKLMGENKTDEELKEITEEAIEKFDLNRNGVIELNEFTDLMIFLVDEKGLSLY